MSRSIEVHQRHRGFMLIMFADGEPRVTLRGADALALSAVGVEWIKAESHHVLETHALLDDWDGGDRRFKPRIASVPRYL